MACTTGLGTLTFGSLTAKFSSPDGFNIGGKTLPAVDCTADDDTTKTYAVGNIPDFGEVTGTLIVDAESFTELKSLAGTSGTLLYTGEISAGSGNTTAFTATGTAIWTSVEINPSENGLLKAPATFKWAGDVTYTNESA